jgi:hypothetical protein
MTNRGCRFNGPPSLFIFTRYGHDFQGLLLAGANTFWCAMSSFFVRDLPTSFPQKSFFSDLLDIGFQSLDIKAAVVFLFVAVPKTHFSVALVRQVCCEIFRFVSSGG